MAKKVLLVSTSAPELGGSPTGLWISELADPYYAFEKAGYEVTIATIAGGGPPIDAGSMSDPYFGAEAKAFMHDAKAMGALTHAAKVDAAMAGGYDAILLAGGHGTCVDFAGPAAAGLKAVVEGTYAAGKVVSAVCHGPVGLLECNKPDGTPILKGIEATVFSNAEEAVVGATENVKKVLGGTPQDLFVAKGATYKEGASWTPNAVVAGKVITGQNPQSADAVAQAVIAALA